MNHTNFCKAFYFTEYRYGQDHHTDARDGAEHHYLGLLEEGRCRIVSEGRTIEAGPGQPFYIPKGLPYQSYWFGPGKVRLRSYGFDLFPEMDQGYALQVLPDGLAGEVRKIPTTGRPDSAALGELFRVLGLALGQMERSGQTPAVCLYQQAVEYMQTHRDCRASEVAHACGVSESALYAAFRRHNSTPNAVRQALLAQEAARLLTTTDVPVQEISDRLGFSSAAYFRKALRQHTGKTPMQIRKETAKV